MQIVPKLGMLTIVEIEAELMNNFQFVELNPKSIRAQHLNHLLFVVYL